MTSNMRDKSDIRVLYLMNVDWSWIAQRPHFLAIELGKYFDVTVVYLKQYIKRWKSQTAVKQTNREAHGIYLPKQDRIPAFQKISDWSVRRAMGNLEDYDIIWIGDPSYFHFIQDYKGNVIYDCMDNNAAFADTKERERKIRGMEQALIHRADCIFCSSVYLKNQIAKQVEPSKVTLLRNGFRSSDIKPVKKAQSKARYKLGYIGTISSWMDFDILRAALDTYEDIEIHMIGPRSEQSGKNYSKRLIFHGVVEHNSLYAKIADFDCLIMPFVINEITLAVDPVKLYEYISFGKCILSVYYDEIKRFKDMVYFYHDAKDFVRQIGMLRGKGFPARFDEEMQNTFLEENSWESRGKIVRERINECKE